MGRESEAGECKWRAVDGQDSRREVKGSMEPGVLVLIVLAIDLAPNDGERH